MPVIFCRVCGRHQEAKTSKRTLCDSIKCHNSVALANKKRNNFKLTDALITRYQKMIEYQGTIKIPENIAKQLKKKDLLTKEFKNGTIMVVKVEPLNNIVY